MPSGHGPRRRTPISAKKRAYIAQVRSQPAIVKPSTAGLPSESWWLKPQAFANPAAEFARMKLSKFGRAESSGVVD